MNSTWYHQSKTTRDSKFHGFIYCIFILNIQSRWICQMRNELSQCIPTSAPSKYVFTARHLTGGSVVQWSIHWSNVVQQCSPVKRNVVQQCSPVKCPHAGCQPPINAEICCEAHTGSIRIPFSAREYNGVWLFRIFVILEEMFGRWWGGGWTPSNLIAYPRVVQG